MKGREPRRRWLAKHIPHTYWLIGLGVLFAAGTAAQLVYRAVTAGPAWLALAAGVFFFAVLGAAAAVVTTWPRDRL